MIVADPKQEEVWLLRELQEWKPFLGKKKSFTIKIQMSGNGSPLLSGQWNYENKRQGGGKFREDTERVVMMMLLDVTSSF